MSDLPTADDVWSRMPQQVREACGRAAEAAREIGVDAYLVGGLVRDLLLGRVSEPDLDIAVEGPPEALAEAIARRLGGAARAGSQFMTCRVDLDDDSHIDVAATRQETYSGPAKLPEVKPADITADLSRRDFSVNALALCLRTDRPGHLIDPCNGRADLASRAIRVLHRRSFSDDPTRVLRAARLAARLAFRIEAGTVDNLREATRDGLLGRLTGPRIRNEVAKLLDEPNPAAPLMILQTHQALTQALPGICFGPTQARRLRAVRPGLAALGTPNGDAPSQPWVYMLGALCAGAARPVIERLQLDRRAEGAIEAMDRALGYRTPVTLTQRRPASDLELDRACRGSRFEALLAYWLGGSGIARGRLERYARRLRPVAADVTGHDLQAQGIPPGSAIRVGLRAARDAKLEGALTRPAQVDAALNAIRCWRAPQSARGMTETH